MNRPLNHPQQWAEEVRARYLTEPVAPSSPAVREFYRLHHRNQTREFVLAQKQKWLKLDRCRMGIWQAMELLRTLSDEHPHGGEMGQLDHNLQTAEAIRRAGQPRWMIIAGLVHDLGKVLWLWDEPQWAVVGDTFPVGCAWSDRIPFHEFLAENPDSSVPEYQTRLGVYEEGCGLDRVELAWGHDEYLYHVVKNYLPPEAAGLIRYHSCYVIHREGAYDYLLTNQDCDILSQVRTFTPFDLYSKADELPPFGELRPFYDDLIREYFPKTILW